MTSTGSRGAELVHRLYELINTRRLDALGEVLSDDFVITDRDAHDREAFARTIQGLVDGFPDIHFVVEDLFAAENRVAVRWTWTGTHRGTFRGTPASQAKVANPGIVIYEVCNNKLTRMWIQNDQIGLLQQIGVLAKPAPQPHLR